MTATTHKTSHASVRPARIAVLVDQSDSDWQDTCCRIIEFYSTLWGGRHNIIVPTDGSTIAEQFWDILEAFDPDYVYYYHKTCEDLRLSQPTKFAEVVDREVKRFSAENPDSVLQNLRGEIEEQLKNAGVSRFGATPQLQASLKARLAPFWIKCDDVLAGGITAGATGHFPLTNLSKILPSCEHPGEVATLNVTASGIPPIWYAPITGGVHQGFAKQVIGSRGREVEMQGSPPRRAAPAVC
jgi:hypothetical protein